MSVLLETRRDGVWSGRLPAPVSALAPPKFEPVVLSRQAPASIVFGAGTITESEMVTLSGLVLEEARRPEIRLVYMAVAIQGGRLGSLNTSAKLLREARRHAAVIAWLEAVAYGPAIWLACQCDMSFAAGSASLGWLECFSEAGEFDADASMSMVLDLADLNPKLERQQWARLLQSAVTGEQAEALGIVGGLKRNVFELSGIDPNSRGPVR